MSLSWQILLGDSRQKLKELADNSVDCVITSPPYFSLRDYGTATWVGGDPKCPHRRMNKVSAKTITGHKQTGLVGNVGDGIFKQVCPLCGAIREDNQIGLESTWQGYVDSLMAVFNEVYRVLKPTGTFWLNIGDTYAGSGKGQSISDGMSDPKRRKVAGSYIQKSENELVRKNLYGIPWRMAFALQDAGWVLRQDIIWHKPQAMPESVKDRCVKAHEYIFLLAKEPDYYFDYKAIQEQAVTEPKMRDKSAEGCQMDYPHGDRFSKGARVYGEDGMRNKRDVWSVNTDHFEGSHFATFPPDLVRPMVLAGSPRGGVILDPFTGSGTTGVVALLEGRNFIGCELNPKYHAMASKRIQEAWEASPSLFGSDVAPDAMYAGDLL